MLWYSFVTFFLRYNTCVSTQDTLTREVIYVTYTSAVTGATHTHDRHTHTHSLQHKTQHEGLEHSAKHDDQQIYGDVPEMHFLCTRALGLEGVGPRETKNRPACKSKSDASDCTPSHANPSTGICKGEDFLPEKIAWWFRWPRGQLILKWIPAAHSIICY